MSNTMLILRLPVGSLDVNCYIVADENTREAAVFDPGGDADLILAAVRDNHLTVRYILNTHAHCDHIGDNQAVQDATGANILLHPDEAPALTWARERSTLFHLYAENSQASGFLEEGDTLVLGAIRFQVLDLRGHSRASLGFLFEGELEWEGRRQHRRFLITGDALVDGSIGRTDFAGADEAALIRNVRTKIFTLPDDTILLYGHGEPSTVGCEKRINPYYEGPSPANG